MSRGVKGWVKIPILNGKIDANDVVWDNGKR